MNVLFIVLFMLPFAGTGLDLIAPSLPHMQVDFQSSSATMKMVLSLYLFGLCVGQIIFGMFSDTFGRKSTLILGLCGFIISTILILFERTSNWLLVLRFFQGFFAGTVAVNARSIITDSFDKERITKVSAYMSLAWSMGPILAPFIGGYIQYFLNWTWSIGCLIIYAAIILILVLFSRETLKGPAEFSPKNLFNNFSVVLSSKRFQGAMLIMGVGFTILVAYAAILPFIIQKVLGRSSMLYGNVTIMIGLSYLIGSLIYRKLIHYFSKNEILKFGTLAMLVCSGSMVFSAFLYSTSLASLYIPIVILTLCVGVVFPCCLSECISLFPKQAGVASAVSGAGFMLFSAIATSIISHLDMRSNLKVGLLLLTLSLFAYLIEQWMRYGYKTDVAGLTNSYNK